MDKPSTLGPTIDTGERFENLLPGPDGGHQVDDEEIVGIQEESHTADGIELQITLGHHSLNARDFGILLSLVLLLRRGSADCHWDTTGRCGPGTSELTRETRLPSASRRL